ncbi:MAG TPA: hypothetical protein VH813_04865 [Candidatus Limnocylindrales bacterium]|jgi:hypothetical protein
MTTCAARPSRRGRRRPAEIEHRKRGLGGTAPETERLSREAELLAERIAGKTTAERELVDEAIADQDGTGRRA